MSGRAEKCCPQCGGFIEWSDAIAGSGEGSLQTQRKLAEKVRDRIAARYDVAGHDGLSARIRALDVDALLEEP